MAATPNFTVVDGDDKRQSIHDRINEDRPVLRLVSTAQITSDTKNVYAQTSQNELDHCFASLKRLALEVKVEAVKLGNSGRVFSHIASDIDLVAKKVDSLRL